MASFKSWLGIAFITVGAWSCSSEFNDAGGDAAPSSAAEDDAGPMPRDPSTRPSPSGGARNNAVPSTGGRASAASGGSGSFIAPGEEDEGQPPGDHYEDPGTNPFVLTEYDPLSTFGADVDTASYDIFRRDVNANVLPAPESVRLEEYVNSFDYAYPAPAEDSPDPFAIHLAAAPSLYQSGTLLLRIGIQGKLAPAERGPANLVFLVDVSGSMAAENKLPLVKVVLKEALEVLEPQDHVSIVTYAGSTAVRLQPTPVARSSEIRAVIDSLEHGGGTAGGAGLNLAYQQAEARFIAGGINHIVMCTDGDFNVGLSSDQELLDLIVEKRKTGVTLTTLGFGSGNLNDSMMEKVSNAGNGMYSVISDGDQAVAYVNDRLLSTMLHIAKDMKIQVEFNRERVLAYRLLGYEDRAIADEDFRDDAVDAGEIGVGHRVTALYEIVPSGQLVPDAPGAPEIEDGALYDGETEVSADDLVLVKVRYKQPGASEADPAAEVASALRDDAAVGSYRDLDADFRWAVAIATFAELLKKSPYARTDLLDEIIDIVEHARGTSGERAEFQTLFTAARPLLEARK